MMTGTFDLGRVTGFSAYEVWKAQPGNENKTEQDFLKFISSGGDWIDFDQTPVDFDKVRDYQTYGSTANLNTDLSRGSVPNDALSIEFSGGTFIFESKSVRNNVRKSTDYDTVQTIILFADASNQVGKYVRYGIYNDDDQLMSFKRIDWVNVDFFSDNGEHIVNIAGRLFNQFSIKIGDVTKKTDGSQNVEFTKEELELGDDWIDFDTTPIDFDSVRTYRTYGSTANLDTDLTRGSVPGDALSAEFSPGTFMFESQSCRNNLKKSTEYDTIQTMILFSGSANPDEFAKYVRYGIFDEDDQTFTVQADWTMSNLFIDNEHIVSKAWKLAKTFNLKIAGVTKPVDGSKTVEFTKEELGLDGESSYFENIFSGYSSSVSVKIGVSVHEAQLESPRLKGDVFLIQLAPAIVKTENFGKKWIGASDSEETFTPNGEVADYSTLLLVSTMNITNERNLPGGYQSYNNYNYNDGGLYNAVIKTEKLISLNGSTYRDVSNGTFITVKVQVDNSGVAWFDAIRPIGMPVFITNIWRLK